MNKLTNKEVTLDNLEVQPYIVRMHVCIDEIRDKIWDKFTYLHYITGSFETFQMHSDTWSLIACKPTCGTIPRFSKFKCYKHPVVASFAQRVYHIMNAFVTRDCKKFKVEFKLLKETEKIRTEHVWWSILCLFIWNRRDDFVFMRLHFNKMIWNFNLEQHFLVLVSAADAI